MKKNRQIPLAEALAGRWDFASLEVDGVAMPPAAFCDSHMLIEGERFRMLSPEADYEGVFAVDATCTPAQIDIHFQQGPEAGNTCLGLVDLDGETVRFCLALGSAGRPTAFVTTPGSGHALELLRRAGAKAAPARPSVTTVIPPEFAFCPAPVFERLAGEWHALAMLRDGVALPPQMLGAARRVGQRNETRVTMGGRVLVEARLRIDTHASPMHVDYLHTGGAMAGKTQLGLMAWDGDDVQFCMAACGDARPAEISCVAGSGRMLSVWRLVRPAAL